MSWTALTGDSYTLKRRGHSEQRGLAHSPDPQTLLQILRASCAPVSVTDTAGARDRTTRSIMNDAFDEALERLRGTGTEVAGGIAPNHGPMGAEALFALGRDDAVVAWADRYRRNLDLMPASKAAITKETWREGLGV